jgi:hypothetical protein
MFILYIRKLITVTIKDIATKVKRQNQTMKKVITTSELGNMKPSYSMDEKVIRCITTEKTTKAVL